MNLDSSILKINCYCGKKSELNREDQKNTFGEEVKIADIAPFYEKLVCSECKKKYPEILDKNNNIIYDLSSTNRCVNCDCLISKIRLQISPKTNFCGKKCGDMINENFEALNRQPYIESNVGFYESSSNFSKPPIVNINKPEIRQLTLILSSRRSEMPRYLYKLIEGDIDKDKYEIFFKHFTWWIKENIEKIGGGLKNDPRNYLECEKCKEIAAINWTNKYNCYFISCSTYRTKKCDWIKNPWYYPE